MTRHTVSFSEIDTYRQCPHKHELAYKQRWTTTETSEALTRGTLWHLLLERHYLELMTRDNTVQQRLTQARDLTLTDAGEHAELLEWMYDGYIKQYGLDEHWEIVAVEHQVNTPLPTLNGGRSHFTLKAKIDLVVRMNGAIWIIDHKTCKNLPNHKELDIDDQFGLYTWAMQQQGHRVMGCIHSAARTQRNKNQDRHPQTLDERYHRTMLYRTPEELNSIAREAYQTARAAYQWPAGEAPRSPNTDTCRWRCNYTEACLLARKGLDEQQVLIDTGYRQDFTRH
jgi:RecB family exonuclease